MHWDSQASGISIPEEVAKRLENLWADFLSSSHPSPLVFAEPSAVEGLQTETLKYIRGRSRKLRDLALNQSNGKCCVCEVDFRKIPGGKGVRVLQVHHRNQLAATDAPRITHLSELAVVCANCHLLIHLNPRQALSVEELKDMLNK